jgi:lipoyl(octanoyl) transferase
MPRTCQLYQCGLVPFGVAWQWQQQLLAARKQDPSLPDVLILLEHPPVYTFGHGADLGFAKFDLDNSTIPWYRIERGGEVTYHAPGQIVAYPILNLRFYQQDLHWYLRQLEEVLILTLADLAIAAERIPGLTGVWVGGQKIAQIGIKCSSWFTMHGFALNVNLDLAGFKQIVPCGISDRDCCSISQFIPKITVSQVQQIIIQKFTQVFNVELISQPTKLFD